jgi:hypothetical protein
MTTSRRFAALALSTALLVGAPAAVAQADQPAERAGKSLRTIATWEGAKQQACKVSSGTKWKVFTRVVNGRRAEVGVGLIVLKNGEEVRRAATKITPKRQTSKLVSVLYPKKGQGFSLEAFQFQGQAGTGGPISITKIKAC